MTFEIDPRKDLTREVRRIAAAEFDRMERDFGARGEGAHQAVHDARKRIKRIRGLYRLVRSGAEPFFRTENARLRDLARSLSMAREATALIETADKLALRFTDPADAALLARLRDALAKRRDRAAEGEIDLELKLSAAAAACRAGRKALSALGLPSSRSRTRKLLVGSVEGSYRAARDGLRDAKASGTADDWHELRKIVKRHMMQVKLMARARPKATKRRARALDQLGELLGDDHDLAVLTALLDQFPILPDCERERVSALAAIRTGELRAEAAASMETLFAKPPRRFSRRIAKRWRAVKRKP